MSEWQPIETAPKDGTEILGWFPDLNHCVQFTHWVETERREYGKIVSQKAQWYCPAWTLFYGAEIKPEPQPTHWMQIPSSPNHPPVARKDSNSPKGGT